MTVKPLPEHDLEFLSLKGGCTGSSESATLLEITGRGSNALLKLDCFMKIVFHGSKCYEVSSLI